MTSFEGRQPRECGEHRTTGPHRAWCFDCCEWCYPDIPCRGCCERRPKLTTAEIREGIRVMLAAVQCGELSADGFISAIFMLTMPDVPDDDEEEE